MSQQGENTETESTLQNGDGTEHGDVSESQSGKNNPQCADEEESIVQESTGSNSPSINDLSSITTGLIRRRAEAEAAKTRIQYAVKELEFRKRQDEIEAELEILNLKREAAEAEGECHILESTMRGASPVITDHVGPETHEDRPQQTTASGSVVHHAAPTSRENFHQNAMRIPSQPTPPHTAGQHTSVNDVTQFLLTTDLLFSRLVNFNDKPESYCAWKYSFQCVVNELQIMDSEPMVLLIKYLGPESRKHALSIRTSNILNIPRGLKRLWERLDERYGAPELVEASIRGKFPNFPKLGNRDFQRLNDLLDILMELNF